VEVLRIDDGSSTPEPLSSDPARPLSGVKVLDLTHVLAGCVGSRTLAEHGATVLHVRPRLYYEKHYGSPEATDAGFVQVRNPIKRSSSVSPDKTIVYVSR
jgi:crotonobetainyl-CoA:carnitine CoA-transferase CaiB-like acyl-CoA transferase